MVGSVMKTVVISLLFLGVVACTKSDKKAAAPISEPVKESTPESSTNTEEDQKATVDKTQAQEQQTKTPPPRPNPPSFQNASDVIEERKKEDKKNSESKPATASPPASGQAQTTEKPADNSFKPSAKPTGSKGQIKLQELIEESRIYGHVSADSVKNVLFNMLINQPIDQAIKDLRKALSVSNVVVYNDNGSGEIFVEITTIDSAKKKTTLKLGGQLTADDNEIKLSDLTNKSNKANARLICLNDKCSVSVIRVIQGKRNEATTLEIIARRSNVSEGFDFDLNRSNSNNITKFIELATNTRTLFVTGRSPGRFINFTDFQSTEVVGGLTEFSYHIKTVDDNLIGIKGRLYNANLGSFANEDLDLNLTPVELMSDSGAPYNVEFQRMIRSAKLVRHDNLGKLQIQLNILNPENSQQDDKFTISVTTYPDQVQKIP